MTNYKDAVKALASSISSSRTTLSREKKLEIARSILAREGFETDRRDINVDFSDEKDFQVMRDYLGALQRARRGELGKNIQASIDNAKRLSKLRDELREDLSEAYDEDEELESIARRLQDKGLGKVAGKEEDQINDLGASLEKLARKGKEVDGLESKLENVLRENGLDRDNLDEELEKRASKVSRLIRDYSEKGEASDETGSDSSGSEVSGPYGGKYGVPTDEPWVISVSDVESDYNYLKKALSLLEDHGWAPIVRENGDSLEWAGNNYRFILNGDLLDRGNNPVSVWESMFNLFSSGRAEMTMGNHDRPILLPKARIKKKQRVHSTAIGEGLPEFPPASDEVELASLMHDADNGVVSRDFSMKRHFAEAIMNDKIKMMAEGYHYFYVHGGARYASRSKMEQANSALKNLVAGPILEDISNGNRSNEQEINKKISRRDGRYQMLFGIGDDSTRDKTAGMIWMSWKNIPDDAGNQIVGHTPVDEPSTRNEGQIINENTSAGSGDASIVVETPKGAFALVEGESEPIDLKGYGSD